MANPITWRNVNQTASAGAAGSLFRGGQQSLTDGFGALQGVLDQARQTQQANHETRRANNTDTFMDRLYSYDSADDLAAAREAGELQALRQQLGPNIDRGAVREALFNQGDNLRNRDTNRANFADFTTRRDQRGVVDQIQTLAAQGDLRGARALMAQHPDLLDRGELATEVRDAGFAQEDQQFQREGNQRGWISTRLAQASNARSAESHNAAMSAANALKAGNAGVSRLLMAIDGAEDQYHSTTLQVAKDMGLPIANGKPDVNNFDEGQRKAYDAAVREAGVELPNGSQYMNQYIDQLRKTGQFDEDQLSAFREDFNRARNEGNTLSSYDAGVVERRLAEVDRVYDDMAKDNMFYTDSLSVNPMDVVEEVSEELENYDFFGFDGPQRNLLVDEAKTLAQQGIKIGDESYKLTGREIMYFLQQAKGDVLRDGSDIREVIRDELSNPDVFQQFVESRNLAGQRRAERVKVEANARGGAGLNPELSLWDLIPPETPQNE